MASQWPNGVVSFVEAMNERLQYDHFISEVATLKAQLAASLVAPEVEYIPDTKTVNSVGEYVYDSGADISLANRSALRDVVPADGGPKIVKPYNAEHGQHDVLRETGTLPIKITDWESGKTATFYLPGVYVSEQVDKPLISAAHLSTDLVC